MYESSLEDILCIIRDLSRGGSLKQVRYQSNIFKLYSFSKLIFAFL